MAPNHMLLLLIYLGIVFLAFVGSRLNGGREMGILFFIMCVTGTVLAIRVMDNVSPIITIMCSWAPGFVLDLALFFYWVRGRSAKQVSQIREQIISMLKNEREALRQRGNELVALTEPMLVTSALIELIFICSNDYSLYDFGDELSRCWNERTRQSEELTQITHRINIIDRRLQTVESLDDLKRLKEFEVTISKEQSEK